MEKDNSLKPNMVNNIKAIFHRLRNVIKIPHFPHFAGLRLSFIKQPVLFLFRHKFWLGGAVFSVALIAFMIVSVYRGYFLTSASTAQNNQSKNSPVSKTNNSVASTLSKPSLASPSPSADLSPSESTVLGTSDDSSSDTTENTDPSPSAAISPLPTDIPEPTSTPTDTSSTSDSSGNSNCTTGSGVPNSWYSDVYPVSPVSASNGSATLTVNIRDCTINDVSSASNLKILLASGDPDTQINGQSLPVTIATQNGQASFTVSSQVAGTVGLTIQDTTDSFGITDTNNNNPSIVFSGSSSTSAPTSTPAPTPTPNSTQSPTPSPIVSPTSIPTP